MEAEWPPLFWFDVVFFNAAQKQRLDWAFTRWKDSTAEPHVNIFALKQPCEEWGAFAAASIRWKSWSTAVLNLSEVMHLKNIITNSQQYQDSHIYNTKAACDSLKLNYS